MTSPKRSNESSASAISLPVAIGVHVELELIDEQGNREPLALDIVKAQSADLAQGFLGANTPLAKAIRGQLTGSEVTYTMGDIRRVRILRVTPSQTVAPADAQERREAVLQKALSDAERTNAEIFASSFSGKWGDYDPQGIAGWNEP
ncbi:MAG: GreA/GreB family elongation factor [Anaerolineae bacterium]